MIEGSNLNKKDVTYPAEVIFKCIFRNKDFTMQIFKQMLAENSIEGKVESKESKNGKFVSYTVTGFFQSEEELNSICTKLTMIEGFMSLF